jgi:hypothetical protein
MLFVFMRRTDIKKAREIKDAIRNLDLPEKNKLYQWIDEESDDFIPASEPAKSPNHPKKRI